VGGADDDDKSMVTGHLYRRCHESKTGPVEAILEDRVAAPAVQDAVKTRSDEAGDVKLVKGTVFRNSFGDLVGWSDPRATTEYAYDFFNASPIIFVFRLRRGPRISAV